MPHSKKRPFNLLRGVLNLPNKHQTQGSYLVVLFHLHLFQGCTKNKNGAKCDFLILKYSKLGPIILASILKKYMCHIQSISRSVVYTRKRDNLYKPEDVDHMNT